MNLIDDIEGEVVHYLQNRGPIDGSRPRVRGVREGGRGVVFGSEDSRQQWIFVGGNIKICKIFQIIRHIKSLNACMEY